VISIIIIFVAVYEHILTIFCFACFFHSLYYNIK
jgi:hypothetical protein